MAERQAQSRRGLGGAKAQRHTPSTCKLSLPLNAWREAHLRRIGSLAAYHGSLP